VSFAGLIVHNLSTRKLRSALTALAVAVGVMTVVTLGVVTHSLRTSAAAVLQTGKADFTVAQRSSADLLQSVVDEGQLGRLRSYPGVASVVGVLVATTKLDSSNPLFLEIGIQPDALTPFGVQVVAGRPYRALATNEIMLGWRAANSLGKHVGDSLTIEKHTYRIVGIFSTGQAFGDSGSMFPLVHLQAYERKPGDVTLAFVRTTPGTQIDALRRRVEHDNPELATVRTASEFGRVDRNLVFIDAAQRAATVLAFVIGAIVVMNTMLLSFFERIREFGILRSVGWSRRRVVALVMGEAVAVSLAGAAAGVVLSFGATKVLENLPALAGILHSDFSAGIFGQALYVAVGIGFVAALYPATRAARLEPLAALRRE
jgi:putative ABC transport system permease protein